MTKYFKDSEKIKKLSEIQLEVTQRDGTERPFTGEFWDSKEEGLYVDVVSGEPLFTSLDKFDSGCGWPSFTKPVKEDFVTERTDNKFAMERVEVRSKFANSHLGHVFTDGPGPLGLRYCINSASLKFIPVDDLEKEGYEDFIKLF